MRMNVNDGPPAIQLCENRPVFCIAEPRSPVAWRETDAVDVKCIEGMRDFDLRRIDVIERYGRKKPEAAGIRASEIGSPFVGLARLLLRRRRFVAEKRTGISNCGAHPVAIHFFERTLNRPRLAAGVLPGRFEMMMDIDLVRMTGMNARQRHLTPRAG